MSQIEMHLNFDCINTPVNCNQGQNCFCEINKRLCVTEQVAPSNNRSNYALLAYEGYQLILKFEFSIFARMLIIIRIVFLILEKSPPHALVALVGIFS